MLDLLAVCQRIPPYYSVFVTCLKLISNVLSVYQRTGWIFHTSAYVGAIRRSVTGPLHVLFDLFQLPLIPMICPSWTPYADFILEGDVNSNSETFNNFISWNLGIGLFLVSKTIWSALIKLSWSNYYFLLKVWYNVVVKSCMLFLRLLIILKYTLDYFYDGSKHYESRSDCNSCHVHHLCSV